MPPNSPPIYEQLGRVELAGALAAVEAVRDSAPGGPPPALSSVADKLRAALASPQPEDREARLEEALATIALGNPDCCREAGVPPRGWCPKCIARAALSDTTEGS